MSLYKRQIKAQSGKTYRFETAGIGSGPVGAIELSIWLPKRIGRDILMYVDYPLVTVHASPSGPSDDEMQEIKKEADQLIATVATTPEGKWAMDRSTLVRKSDRVVIDLMAAHNEVHEPVFVTDPDVPWYIGQGEKLAVHRAGLIPIRTA